MINEDGGGGQFSDFMGGHSCYEGGHGAHGGSPRLGKTLLSTIVLWPFIFYSSFLFALNRTIDVIKFLLILLILGMFRHSLCGYE